MAACCGNAVVELAEACDDGNRADGDGCSARCSTEGTPTVVAVTTRARTDDDGRYPIGLVVEIVVKAEPSGSAAGGRVLVARPDAGWTSPPLALTASADGRLVAWLETSSLMPAAGYEARVQLADGQGRLYPAEPPAAAQATFALEARLPAPRVLAQSIDMYFPGPGLPFRFVRTYDVTSAYEGPLGRGWTHTYDAHLVFQASGYVTLFESDLRGTDFLPGAPGGGAAQPWDRRTLVRRPDGMYELRHPDGRVHLFDAAGRLRSITDALGRAVVLHRDSAGLLTGVEDAAGRVFAFRSDERGRLSEVAAPGGPSCTYTYDAAGHLALASSPAGGTLRYAYDAAHHLQSTTDETGHALQFQVGEDHRLQTVSEDGGIGPRAFGYDDAAGTITVEDSGGRRTTLAFDPIGTLALLTGPDGAVTAFGHEGFALREVLDPLGGQTRYAFDAAGNLLSVVDALGGTTSYAYEGGNPSPASITDSTGASSAWIYDTSGLLAGLTPPGEGSWTASFAAPGQLTSITDPAGNHLVMERTPSGLPARLVSASGAAWKFGYSNAGHLVWFEDPLSRQTQLAYDDHGRLIEMTQPGSAAFSFDRDGAGRLTKVWDPSGHGVGIRYDGASRFVGLEHEDHTTQFVSLDGDGRLVSATDRSGGTTRYSRDVAGRLGGWTRPSGGVTTLAYDRAGRLSEARDAAGAMRVIRDAAGRATRIEGPSSDRLAMAHDAVGRLTRLELEGVGSASYEYTPAGRVKAVQDGAGRVLARYSYLPNGRDSLVELGNGVKVEHTHDADGRVVGVRYTGAGSNPLAEYTYTYDAAGRRVSASGPSGVTSYTYDDLGRLASAQYAGGRFDRFTYDKAGNRTTHESEAGRADYAYGALHQLLRAGQVMFTYDSNGNVATRQAAGGTLTFRWGPGPGLVLDEPSSTSPMGRDLLAAAMTPRPIGVGGPGSQLENISGPGADLALELDPFGRVRAIATQGSTRRLVYCGLQTVAELGAGEAAWIVPGPELDRPVARVRGGITHWFMYDGAGNVVGLLDAQGRVVETYAYRAFGEPMGTTAAANDLLFQGRPYLSSAGLYQMRGRVYDPTTGRFLSPDPLRGSLLGRPYQYADNDPINRSDPLGLASQAQLLPAWSDGPSATLASGGVFDLALLDYRHARPAIRVVPWVTPPPLPATVDFNATFGLPSLFDDASGLPVLTSEAGGALPWAPRTSPASATLASGTPPGFDPASSGSSWTDGGSAPPGVTPGPDFAGDPSFHQPDQDEASRSRDPCNPKGTAEICFPQPWALVRGDLPIIGRACGRDVVRYRVEVGEGAAPSTWTLARESTQQACEDVESRPAARLQSGDAVAPGNLATINTGLKAYPYPTHPLDDPTDLKGVRTFRLLVERRDGSILEDRVTVRVGDVVPNALGGTAEAPDGGLRLRFPEQALADSFRVFSVERSNGTTSKGGGSAYVVRPFAEELLAAVQIEMSIPDGVALDRAAICTGPAGAARQCLPTEVDAARRLARSTVWKLAPRDHVYQVVAAGPLKHEAAAQRILHADLAPEIADSFEDGLGHFAPRHGAFGAALARVACGHGRAGTCLRLTGGKPGGTLGVTARSGPFDAARLGWVRFAYRVPPQVHVNLFAKVGGRWYDVGFTDLPKAAEHTADGFPYYKGIRMEPVGQIAEVVADGRWHVAAFDLLSMLRTRTEETLVEELVFADWDSEGYLKLSPGQTLPGMSFELDDFALLETGTGSGIGVESAQHGARAATASPRDGGGEPRTEELFAGDLERHALGAAGMFTDAEHLGRCAAESVDRGAPGEGLGRMLRLECDVSAPGAYAGIFVPLEVPRAASTRVLTVEVRGHAGGEGAILGLRDGAGHESKVYLEDFLHGGLTDRWTEVAIPLGAFRGLDLGTGLRQLSLGFGAASSWARPAMLLASAHLRGSSSRIPVLDFETPGNVNLLGGPWFTYDDGAAHMRIEAVVEASSDRGATALALSYEGVVRDRYSFSTWGTHLGGADASGAEVLRVRLRRLPGSTGVPFLFLNDFDRKAYVQVSEDVSAWTDGWHELRVPLRAFAEQGVDLRRLKEIVLAMQWSHGDGTLLVDDLAFDTAGPILVPVPAYLQDPAAGPAAPPVPNRVVLRPEEGAQ